MEKKDKPRLAELLGVEEDEEWKYPGLINTYRIHNGVREHFESGAWLCCLSEIDLTKIINHPESIIRVPRLTEPELAICKALGATWVSIGNSGGSVMLTKTKPIWDDKYHDWLLGKEHNILIDPIARIKETLFPSLHPGDCIEVEPD